MRKSLPWQENHMRITRKYWVSLVLWETLRRSSHRLLINGLLALPEGPVKYLIIGKGRVIMVILVSDNDFYIVWYKINKHSRQEFHTEFPGLYTLPETIRKSHRHSSFDSTLHGKSKSKRVFTSPQKVSDGLRTSVVRLSITLHTHKNTKLKQNERLCHLWVSILGIFQESQRVIKNSYGSLEFWFFRLWVTMHKDGIRYFRNS